MQLLTLALSHQKQASYTIFVAMSLDCITQTHKLATTLRVDYNKLQLQATLDYTRLQKATTTQDKYMWMKMQVW